MGGRTRSGGAASKAGLRRGLETTRSGRDLARSGLMGCGKGTYPKGRRPLALGPSERRGVRILLSGPNLLLGIGWCLYRVDQEPGLPR